LNSHPSSTVIIHAGNEMIPSQEVECKHVLFYTLLNILYFLESCIFCILSNPQTPRCAEKYCNWTLYI